MPGHDIIVVGASAGGVEILENLVQALAPKLPASIFVVIHSSRHSPRVLDHILNKAGTLPAIYPADKTKIEKGHIYLAPPDYHLLLEHNRMRIVRGPEENRHRPAIDPLFRSAAWAYGPRAVGVILSGMLDDGVAGLWAIKSSGGISIVQDPKDAAFPEMPINAMQRVKIDYVLPREKIARLLSQLATQPVPRQRKTANADKLELETEFTMMQHRMKDMAKLGQPSVFSCPSCGGTMWELQDGELIRYRCHTGHAFSPEALLEEQSQVVEDALYSALRALQEKTAVYRRLAEQIGNKRSKEKARYEKLADEQDQNAAALRKLLAARDL